MDVHGALDVLLRDPKPNHRTMINFYHSFSPEVERARRVFIFVYSRETSYQASRWDLTWDRGDSKQAKAN